MVVLILFCILLLVLASIVLSGHGDKLIAGYNTLSPKEREGYHVKRLRWVVAIMLFLTAVLLLVPWLMRKDDDVMTVLATAFYIFIICIVAVVLANTWCKR